MMFIFKILLVTVVLIQARVLVFVRKTSPESFNNCLCGLVVADFLTVVFVGLIRSFLWS